jgi:amino acid transporter
MTAGKRFKKFLHMEGTDEDKRIAATVQAGIGSQLLAASLVLMGILLGYFDIKNIRFFSWAGCLLIVAIAALFISFIVAGYGLKKLRDNGNKGNWDYSKTHVNFRIQTWLNYLAIILFIFVFRLPPEKSKSEKSLEEINSHLITLIKMDSINNLENRKLVQTLIDQLSKVSLKNNSTNLQNDKHRGK